MPNNEDGDDDPTVVPRPIGTPTDENRVSPEAFGSGVGGLVEKQGAVLDHIGEEYQQRANAVAVEGAFGKAQAALNARILDPKSGYLSLKGQDALDKANDFAEKFQQDIATVRGSLQNDAQKREIGFRLDRLQETGLRLAASHERSQHDVIAEAASKGSEAASTQALVAVAANPSTDDETLRKTLSGGVSDLFENARQDAMYRYGKAAGPEAIKAIATPKIQQAAALAVESAIATEDPAHAQRVYQQLRPFLGTQAGLRAENYIQRRLDTRDGLGWAQAAAQASITSGTTLVGDKADLMLEQLSSQNRPEMVRVAEQELQRLKVAGRQMQKDRNNSAFTAGVDAVNKGNAAAFNKAYDTLAVPAGEGGELLKTLIDFKASHAAKDAHSPAVIRAQAIALNDAQHLLAASRASDYDSANAFMLQKTDPNNPDSPTIMQTLSSEGIKQFGNHFEAKFQKEQADKALSPDAEKQILDNITEALSYPDIKVSEPTKDQKAERAAIQGHVRDQRNAWQEANPGKQPGKAEYQGWIDEELAKVPGTGGWFSSDKRRVDVDLATPAAPPVAAATPAAPPAPTPLQRPQRTVNGVTKFWDGQKWVDQ